MKTLCDLAGRFWSLLLLSFAFVVISPETIFAHGGPPAALGLIAADAQGPNVILLNEGLALKRPQAWSYMCPSLWGEINQTSGKFPMSRSADGISSWVIGEDDLYVLRDQRLAAAHRPELSRNDVIALANDALNVYALHFNGSGMGMGTDVMLLSEQAQPPVWSSTDYWSAINADTDGVHLARVAGEKLLEVVTIDKAGQEQNRAMATLELSPLEIDLHTSAGRLYVTANDGNTWIIGYFEGTTWKQVVSSKVVVLGPQASPDGTLWMSISGALQRLQNDMPQPVDEMRMITCLEQWNDWRYACVGSDMYKLSESGLGEQVFGMDGFHAPDPLLVPPDQVDNCEQQWVLYTVDAVRSGINFVDWPSTADAGAAGAAGGAAGQAATAGAGAPILTGAAGSSTSLPVAGTAALAPLAPASSGKSSGGCSALAASGSSRSSLALALAVMTLASGVRLLRRRRSA